MNRGKGLMICGCRENPMETDGKLVIIGAGETAAIAYEYFTHDSTFSVGGFCV